jgi:hypothetical protein
MSYSLYLLHIKKAKKVEQYPIDYTTDIFKKYVKKLKHAQHLFVEKKGINVYYTYLRRLNASNTDYYGFCFAFTGEYIENVEAMFLVCETLLDKTLKQNELLSGSMPLNLQIKNPFHTKSPELERIEEWFNQIASHYHDSIRPFIGAVADTSEIEKQIGVNNKEDIIYTIKNYNHINFFSNKLTNGVANVVEIKKPTKLIFTTIFYISILLLLISAVVYNNYRIEQKEKQAKIEEAEKNKKPKIHNIEIGNGEKAFSISNFGEDIYSQETVCLFPKIYYTSYSTNYYKLDIKWYNPNGGLIGESSEEYTLYKGNSDKILNGWENKNKKRWKAGNYKIEIWCEGVKLSEKYFTIHSKKS